MGVIPRHTSRIGSSNRSRRAAGALRAGVAVALVAAAIGLAGCTPGPAPKPTPTPLFTSEADAFKAAEQVFRDYIETVNSEESDSTADPQRFLAGKALDEDVASVRDLKSSGHRIVGATVISDYRSKSYAPESKTVTSLACLDVSATRIMDASGNDITSKNRPSIVAVEVSLTLMSTEFKIVGMNASDEPCS